MVFETSYTGTREWCVYIVEAVSSSQAKQWRLLELRRGMPGSGTFGQGDAVALLQTTPVSGLTSRYIPQAVPWTTPMGLIVTGLSRSRDMQLNAGDV